MIGGLVDGLEGAIARFRVPLSVLGTGWFALTCAAHAGFISLPSIALVTGLPGIILAGLWNAVWWGWFYPRAEQRRIERHGAGEKING